MNSEDKFKLSRSTSSVDVVLHSVTGRVCVLILLDTIWQNRVGSVRWGGLALWRWWVNSGPLWKKMLIFASHFIRPIHLYLIFEKSSLKNQIRQTGFLVYFELDFYCLCSLQKSISKLIFESKKYISSNLIFLTWFFKIQVQINRGKESLWRKLC